MTAQTARNRRTADGTMMALGSGWGCPKPTRRGRSWKIGQTHGLGARFPQLSSSIAGMVHASKAELPRLSAAHWPTGAYRREDLPERVLQFGTGMLLRALCATFVDAANTAGTFSGRSVVIQSTPHGQARALNAQDGLFTLVERGLEHGAPVERTRLIGAISRALIADAEWPAARDLVARPELQVIVSNVTEAGFRPDAGFPARLTDLLHTRFVRLREGPPVFVIPTELVDENGPRLAAMVHHLAEGREHRTKFREWLGARVRFCSSLVDRITTGMPAAHVRATLEQQLGYSDALLTVTEPHALWAIEADPAELRATFAIDATPDSVIIAPDTDLPADAAVAFAGTVIDRFRNPWLDHEWRVIAANQTAKLRLRVVPSLTGFARKRGAGGITPQGLALGLAAYLQWARSHPAGDADLPLIERHWRTATTLQGLAGSALADADLWGANLAELPGLLEATTRWLVLLERDGVDAALAALPGTLEHAATGRTSS